MQSGKRTWWVFVLPLLACLLAIAFWPAKSPIAWTYRTGFNPLSPPVVGSDGTIYIGSRRGELIAIDPGGLEKWVVDLGMGMVGEVVIGPDGNIYAPWSGGGQFSGLASVTPTGSTNWFFKETGNMLASPSIAPDGALYLGGHSSNVHALNPDGSIRWKFATQGIIDSPPVITPDGNIGIVSHDQHFYLFDREGAVIVRRELTNQYPPRGLGYSPEGYWVVGTGSKIHALNADGSHRWTTDLLTFPVPRTNNTYAPFVQGTPQFDADGHVLLSTGNGYIYQLTADGNLLSAIDKGARTLPGSEADLAATKDHRLLLAYEEGFAVPLSPTSFRYGTDRAAVMQLAPDGSVEWRTEFTGSFEPIRLLDFPRYKENLKLGFGRREQQGLSRPVRSPDGTVYVRSIKGLHAIHPPPLR